MDYITILLRIATVIPLFLAAALTMGKRHIGELSVFDLVIVITMGAVAGADLADPDVPHGPTLMTIAVLALLHFLISRLVLTNRSIGRLLTFDPTVVIQNGVILHSNLKRIRYTVDELLSHLREQNIFDPREASHAVLEPSGVLSVLKTSEHQPVTRRDMNMPQSPTDLSPALIIEGQINHSAINACNMSQEILLKRLAQMGYPSPDTVFLCTLSPEGELYVSPQRLPRIIQRLDQ